MKKILCTLMIVAGTATYAQVGIGTAAPNKSAMLDIKSTSRGLLIPNVSLTGDADTSTITNGEVESLLVYNTATANTDGNAVTPGYYYWSGTKWNRIIGETVENGLTNDGSSLTLGGSLTKVGTTTIAADAENAVVADRKFLAITGLAGQQSTQNNLMVVTDAVTGELRTASISSPFTVENIAVDTAAEISAETYLVNNTADATITLPSAAANSGKKFYIKKISNNEFDVKIVGATGTETIEGILDTAGISGGVYLQTWLLQSDGANWYVIK